MLVVAAVVCGVAAWPWAILPVLLGAFFLWFFRDPERVIPDAPGMIVSPADGKVTHIESLEVGGERRTRISIFLSVFDVHVNRSPIAGTIEAIEYRRGSFGNAMSSASADRNEQNIVTVRGLNQAIIFKQIAGLLARRIVFAKHLGDRVERGERVGLIKFGSRTDLIMGPEAAVQVKIGEHVRGGATVLAQLPVEAQDQATPAVSESVRGH